MPSIDGEPRILCRALQRFRTVDKAKLKLESEIDRRGEMPDVISGTRRLSISVGHELPGIAGYLL